MSTAQMDGAASVKFTGEVAPSNNVLRFAEVLRFDYMTVTHWVPVAYGIDHATLVLFLGLMRLRLLALLALLRLWLRSRDRGILSHKRYLLTKRIRRRLDMMIWQRLVNLLTIIFLFSILRLLLLHWQQVYSLIPRIRDGRRKSVELLSMAYICQPTSKPSIP